MNAKPDAVIKMMLVYAEREVIRLGHTLICPAHIMLVLLQMRSCNAMVLMTRVINDEDIDAIRTEIERQIGSGPEERISGPIILSDRCREVIRLASEDVTALGDNELATQHLLLALLSVEGVVPKVLSRYGVYKDSLRDQMKRLTC
jgi:ATP-dependent Clp protease ATP-binding subunit ClpC